MDFGNTLRSPQRGLAVTERAPGPGRSSSPKSRVGNAVERARCCSAMSPPALVWDKSRVMDCAAGATVGLIVCGRPCSGDKAR